MKKKIVLKRENVGRVVFMVKIIFLNTMLIEQLVAQQII